MSQHRRARRFVLGLVKGFAPVADGLSVRVQDLGNLLYVVASYVKAVQYEDVPLGISKIKSHLFATGRRMLFINQGMLNYLKNTTDFKSRDYIAHLRIQAWCCMCMTLRSEFFDHMPVGTISDSSARPNSTTRRRLQAQGASRSLPFCPSCVTHSDTSGLPT